MTHYESKFNNEHNGSEDISMVQENVNKAKQKAGELAGEVKQGASELSDQAKAETKSSLQTRKDVAAQELHGVAQALRQTSSTLREQDQTMFAQYSNQVADRVERVSSYLEEHDIDDLINEAEDFARRQPELFIGGAFTLGLLAARFLKSSASSLVDNRGSNLPERSLSTAVSTNAPSSEYYYAAPDLG